MNCLRCGREIAENATFCESCENAVSEPLVESAYLSKQIHLPVRKPPQPQPKAARKTERKPEEEAKPRGRGAIVFLIILCMLILAAGLYVTTLFLDGRSENAALAETVSALEKDKDKLETEIAALEDSAAGLEAEIADLEKTVTGLEAEKDELQQTLDFVDSNVVFAAKDGSIYYHTCSCPHFDKNDCSVYDLKTAEARGFLPCPYCH